MITTRAMSNYLNQLPTINKQEINILKLICLCVFAGRAWEHIRWDPPFRGLLLDQSLMEPIIATLTGLTWFEYSTSPQVDNFIQNIIFSFGCLYLVCAVASIIFSKTPLWAFNISKTLLLIGSLGLAFLAFLYCKDQFFQIGHFFEYSCQFGAPLLLLYTFHYHLNKDRLVFYMKCAVSLTFFCHGLYAIGFYPIPGNWVDMLIVSLGVTEETAYEMLRIAGVLDIWISFAIFMPGLARPALIYGIFWGLLTSFSSIYVKIYDGEVLQSLQQYSHEVLYRIPHFGLPVLILVLLGRANSTSSIYRIIGRFRTNKKQEMINS
ncbi:MAG: hypothetical protein ACK4ND_07465 [Cytophagaceae bacterium]